MADKTPLWRSIGDSVAADITAGRYGAGDRLPTEAELSARFGVNRHTVRRALAALAEAGIVHSRRGAGVFVTDPPTDYPIGKRTRFTRNIRAAGRLPHRQVLMTRTRTADAEEREALALPAGAGIVSSEGLSLADGRPLAIFLSVFPAARFPNIGAGLERLGSVTLALEEAGISDYTRLWTRLTARRADASQANHLRITEGDPLIYSVGLNTDADGHPVEYGRTWFAGERVTLTLSED